MIRQISLILAAVILVGCKKRPDQEGAPTTNRTLAAPVQTMAQSPLNTAPIAGWARVKECASGEVIYQMPNGKPGFWVDADKDYPAHWTPMADGVTAEQYCALKQ